MSQENVELVKASIEAYIAGDRELALDFYTEDVEGYRRFLAEIEEGWEGGASAVIREVFAVGDRVVARMDWGGRGRTSGIDLRSNLTAINTVRDGRIVKSEWFFDHAQAL